MRRIENHMSRQLEEIASWRLITELWRRFPERFDLVEAHPGGGQYDCLALLTKEQNPSVAIDVNRGGGSVHVHRDALGLDGEMAVYPDWLRRMLGPTPAGLLDDIARTARLEVPKKLAASTSASLVYRYISEFLAHSICRLENWECRNGVEDSSGYGGGVRRQFFERFPLIRKQDDEKYGAPIPGKHARNFWFLVRNGEPILCLDTGGRVIRLDGSSHDLLSMYGRSRRVWPLICETALDVLP